MEEMGVCINQSWVFHHDMGLAKERDYSYQCFILLHVHKLNFRSICLFYSMSGKGKMADSNPDVW